MTMTFNTFQHSIHKLLFILLLSTILISCSHIQTGDNPPAFTITINEPDRIRFSGKGAGAGMMLMGAMGPMGIAIGVAIDEGIAKEIDESARKANFDIQRLTHNAFSHAWQNKHSISIVEIQIKHYGFKLASGENDLVSPEFQLIISTPQGKKLPIQYPDSKIPQLKGLTTAPLERIKKEGELSIKLYQEALNAIAAYAAANIGKIQ